MWVRKEKAGTAGEHVWDKDGAVVEVPDSLGEELVATHGAGFSEAEAPKRAPKKDDASEDGKQQPKPDSEDAGEKPAEGDEPKLPARRGRPPKKTVEE